MENKIIALTKSFEDEKIRTVWNKEEEKYYISIVDMIKVLTESTEPRKYWNWLNNKLLKEENF